MADDDPSSWGAIPAAESPASWGAVPSAPAQPVGTAEALGRGLASGSTMGWYDELRGLAEAGGAAPDQPMRLWNILLGGYRKAVGDEAAGQHYDAAVARERGLMQRAQEQHPYAYGAGELGGTVAGMAAIPIGGEVGLAGRAIQGAKLGAITGAISGAGEAEGGLGQRLSGAAIGAGEGLAGGAISAPIASAVEGAGRLAYDAFGRPIVSAVRGAINPEREAARRTVGAIERDISTGRAGLDPRDWQAAQATGEPVSIMDLGGETTRALARSAANTSPEGKGALTHMVQDRFAGQNVRASDLIRSLVRTPANADLTREQLEDAARIANAPLYRRAFADGQDIPFHAGFQQLLEAPVVRDAVRDATVTGANKAAAQGFKPVRNPFTFDAHGLPSLTNPNVKPSLQFWDAVKQNLDDRIGSLQRAGANSAARDAIVLKNQLVGHLDQAVPSYAQARGTAAQFFGADNAVEAGGKAFSFKGNPQTVGRTMSRMNPAERDMFREGYASKWVDDIRGKGDGRDITKVMYQSPQARELAQTILGQPAANQLEAFMHRERIMNFARNAVTGNSTTAAQLAMMGLAGGAMGGYLNDWNPRSIGAGAIAGALMHHGTGKLVGYVDENVARRVAELLASDDISQLGQGLRMAARHGNILARLRDLDTRIASSTAVRGAPALQAGAIGYGQDNQQNVPGPPGQHKDGGGVGQQNGAAHSHTLARRHGGGIPHRDDGGAVPDDGSSLLERAYPAGDPYSVMQTGRTPETAAKTLGALGDIASSVPPVSTAIHALDAFGRGLVATGRGEQDPADALSVASSVMGGGLGRAPVPGEAVFGSGPIRAYHGSPHDFGAVGERPFDMSKVGTGEGAQAYGHGMYFAESEPTALSYKQSTSDLKDWNVVGDDVNERVPSWLAKQSSASPRGLDMSIADFNQRAAQLRDEGHWNAEGIQKIADALQAVKDGRAELKKPGHMYEVGIHADPEHFLDWDKPLSQQPAALAAIERMWRTRGEKPPENLPNLTGAGGTGYLEGQMGAEGLSKALREAGIPGVKYYDQRSRGDVGGTRNFVVFDPSIVEVLRKYGIAGLVSAGVAHAAMQGNDEPKRAKGGRVTTRKQRVAAILKRNGVHAA